MVPTALRGFQQFTRLLTPCYQDVVTSKSITLALSLDSGVLDVGELAELAERLNSVAQHLGQLVRVHIATKRIGNPNLTSHDFLLKG